MRTVYLGTSGFAATVLELLALSDHAPVLVVTRPDRPRGRGRRLQSPPVAATAHALGLDLGQPADVNADEARRRIAAARPEAVCICAYGALIREPLLSEHELLNVHPSLLPRWRGAAPVERAIESGDPQTGVSIMRAVAELDAGPIFLARTEPIRPDDDYGSLSGRLARLSADLLVETLETAPEPEPQSDRGATYAAKIVRDDRRLDPARSPEELERLVRALTPHIGAYAEVPGGEQLGVRRAAVWHGGPVPGPGALEARDQRLILGAEGGAIELLEVQPAGRRPMGAADYPRGSRSAGRQDVTRA
ncbi:methionyl-tRNA formyltransferase [soil metagenome]